MDRKFEVISGALGTLAAHAERDALVLSEDLTLEALGTIGEALGNAERTMSWWFGDWWLHVRRRYGSAGLLKLVDAGCKLPALATLKRAAQVASAFQKDRRRSSLTFSHHAEVANLADPSLREWLLDRAEQFGWSSAKLRSEVSQRKLLLVQRPEVASETCGINDLNRLIAAGRRFGTIYADPPWPYGNQATRASTRNHYKREDDDGDFSHRGMELDELCGLPVAELAAPDCHCHLWTTNAFLRQAFDILDSWGFTYKTTFVWTKPQLGIGNYWRVGHEFMLSGIRGKAAWADKNQQSWLHAPRGEHSAKPWQVRKIIENVSPAPRLELFARIIADGWTGWGNEIETADFDVAAGMSKGVGSLFDV